MSTILIIDDRPKERAKVVSMAQLSIPKGSGWTAKGIDPLPKMEEYPSLLMENDVGVLVLDEKLQEQGASDTGISVQYDGHELVKYLRPHFPELPIFVVTAFDREEELQNSASDVEGIIPRMSFAKEPKVHTARMLRSGQRFSAALQEDLSRLAELSRKIAIGSANPDEVKQTISIREKLSLSFPSADLMYAKDLIPKAERLIEGAQALLDSIKVGKAK